MFIKPIKCDSCGFEGRPGSNFMTSGYMLFCKCGHTFTISDWQDQNVLSENIFVRLGALANATESGKVNLLPGQISYVTFSKPFDHICRTFLTPTTPILVQEAHRNNTGMIIMTGTIQDTPITEETEIAWIVYGLRDIDLLPSWKIQFFAATSHSINGLYKPAVFNYATSFEVFLETYLSDKLNKRFGQDCTDYLLQKTWRVEDRCKDLLELASGHRLTELSDVYQPWDTNVRRVRNDLAHGKAITVDQVAAELAHQATYQAIRWIECLS